MTLKLREERQRRGWSLVDVTMKTRIAGADVSLIERGLRPAYPGWRRRLSQAFGVPEAELFAKVRDDGS